MEPWCRSNILHTHMESLIQCGLLLARTEALEWIIPGNEDAPTPPDGYVISFIPFHEHGHAVPLH
jgi:hypothetical protein